MKKIYSILALALTLGVGEAYAQEAEVVIDNPNATIEEIQGVLNSKKTTGIGTLNLLAVKTSLEGATFTMEGQNANTVILCNYNNQPANTANVLTKNGQFKRMYTPIVITDGVPFLCTEKFDANGAEYHRYNVKNEYNTLCLPFCFNVKKMPENYHFEYLSGVLEDGTLVFSQLTSSKNTVADRKTPGHLSNKTPCILHIHDFDPEVQNDINIVVNYVPAQGDQDQQGVVSINKDEPASYPMNDKYELIGHMTATTITEDSEPMLYIQDNMFWKWGDFEGDILVPAYRCTIKVKELPNIDLLSKNSFAIISVDDDATAIKNVVSSNNDVPAYNLQGIRVAADAKGFVVKNGKKYFNK